MVLETSPAPSPHPPRRTYTFTVAPLTSPSHLHPRLVQWVVQWVVQCGGGDGDRGTLRGHRKEYARRKSGGVVLVNHVSNHV